MHKNDKLLVIMPAYNEANNIASVITELKSTELPLDILVVDDGSTDATAEVVSCLDVHLIRLPFNLGIGGAVQTGFRFAVQNGYDIAIQLDSDGQHIPQEIPKLLKPILRERVDMCIGSRYLQQTEYQTPLSRRIGMIFFSIINSLLVGQRITDNTSGFRAFNRRTIEFLAENYPIDYPEPETIVMLGRNGFHIQECAVNMRKRKSGESSITTLLSFYYMFKVLLSITAALFKTFRKTGALSL
ncbi:MAG: glycosyltransferase family 2 protein [Bdellovibrio sp.]|nr:glycosyltransferase family 2 protein [Bdellovibrio sp.]